MKYNSYIVIEDRYAPIQNGIRHEDARHVTYIERMPMGSLASIVASIWELTVTQPLEVDFTYTVMPDACLDLIFDISPRHATPFLMTPFISIETINLGRSFHYVGLRFRPGVFTDSAPNAQHIVGRHINSKTFERIDLEPINGLLQQAADANERFEILQSLAVSMRSHGYITSNPLIEKVIASLHTGASVGQVALESGYSPRQLRRITKQYTGYTPIQLHRVLRFQAVLSQNDNILRFTDQSHLIKEFKKITGSSYRYFVKQFK